MRKFLAVFKREYAQVVRKKSFIIMTLLIPFFLMAMIVVPSLLVTRGASGKRVAILDATGRLAEAFQRPPASPSGPDQRATTDPLSRRRRREARDVRFEYVGKGGDLRRDSYLARLGGKDVPEERKLDAVLEIPEDAVTNEDAKVSLYSRSAADFVTPERLARLVNQGVWKERLVARGIEASATEELLARVNVDSVQISKSGRVRQGGELNFLAAFLFAALLLIPMFAYGQEIMRGIVQEKTDRVVEILVSSMSPLQLLSGKILGLAAAALTQVGVWLVMAGGAATYLGTMAAAGGMNPLQFFEMRVIPFFVIFFLLGFLTFCSFYAVAGAATNSDKEAQQFVTPIMFFILFPWFLAMPILQAPDSRLAVILSLIPIFTPITMFLRVLVSEPPAWQLALSIVLSAATVYGLFWLTAKVFRVGILSYGKRPTIPELWRWLKVA
ncbi:MAG: ABC transporter permease [Thermoanaerobaculia bacterium]